MTDSTITPIDGIPSDPEPEETELLRLKIEIERQNELIAFLEEAVLSGSLTDSLRARIEACQLPVRSL